MLGHRNKTPSLCTTNKRTRQTSLYAWLDALFVTCLHFLSNFFTYAKESYTPNTLTSQKNNLIFLFCFQILSQLQLFQQHFITYKFLEIRVNTLKYSGHTFHEYGKCYYFSLAKSCYRRASRTVYLVADIGYFWRLLV